MKLYSRFCSEPAQTHFMESAAKIRGYGGAMGGGKTRTMCETVFDLCLDYPGIQIPIFRQKHTAIMETTRRTMMTQVLGPVREFIARKKESQGEDWVELKNGSKIFFAGLDDPVKWFSSEIGACAFDEAHEIAEADVHWIITRLRQPGMPHKALIGFNPSNPGHWLEEWFVKGAAETDFGFYKKELYVTTADKEDGAKPIGDCEFIFANAYQNPYLPEGYIDSSLKSLPPLLRQRMLEGLWVLTDGSGFFDPEALKFYSDHRLVKPITNGATSGDTSGKTGKLRVELRADGPLAVWKAPVRGEKPHRYIVAADVSGGGSADYSAIHVIDIDAFEQVAEYQAKVTPDLLAVEVFRLALIYNSAMIAVEVTGGWGQSAIKTLEKLQVGWRGKLKKPPLYTRKIEDRLAKKFTDALGWDTSTKNRMVILDNLEEQIRAREFGLYGRRTHSELGSFNREDKTKTGRYKPPQAAAGTRDDLVMALAIGLYVAMQQPRELRRTIVKPYRSLVGSTGY